MVHQTINFKIFYLLLAICCFSYYSSFSKEYNVDKSAKNIVKFISDAPMEDFEGITNKIDGYLINDDISNLKNSDFYFEVDLNSVKTGIALRDRHMREDYLNTAKYRYTSFKGKIIDSKKINDNEYEFTAKGNKFISGITKEITIKGIIYNINNSYRIKANWSIKLPDFNIKVPQFMFLRINEEIKLEVDFYLKRIN